MENKSEKIEKETVAEALVAEISAQASPIALKTVEIPSPYAKKWYDIGFLFAVNYIYARLPEADASTDLIKRDFKAFINRRFTFENGSGIVDDTYFDRIPFKESGPINYPSGQCPGDLPNTCIPCAANGITPLP